MKPKERVLTAVEHKEPDRVPLDDFYRESLWKSIKIHYGVTDEVAVRKKLGVDFFDVTMNAPAEFRKRATHPANMPNMPYNTVISLPDGLYQDEWEITYKVGATGEFWHFVDHPLRDLESLEDYTFPDINAEGRFEEAERLSEKWGEEFAIAPWLNWGFFQMSWFLRGYEKFIHDLYTNPRFVDSLLDKILEFRIGQGKRFVEMGVDIVRIGDDIGVQTGMMINPNLWRKYFKPRLEKLIKTLKAKRRVYIFYHSDGNIRQVIPDLIEIGVDILNPIQPECMNPSDIKQRYGDKLTLHGTISLQKTLSFGSMEEVAEEVRKRIETCGQNGGLIIAPSNGITPDVPFENVLTMYEATKKYGRYPLRKGLI
jgi:uroporphyrinogen decarboxylase